MLTSGYGNSDKLQKHGTPLSPQFALQACSPFARSHLKNATFHIYGLSRNMLVGVHDDGLESGKSAPPKTA